ncbi:efflux transporter outer membrane subunit [Steroidobacter cummioxidans]|uniref:efflux transporter outer membrane subunit n=1 Tax=Steroidobacter cummioxidans TaxID=1803913 RepID=UPI0013795A43|nr:efflux transporter outer membrane subunit [Steroidobacter cummioxidans]
MFRSLVTAGAMVALSACAVGPDFKRPDAPTASRYVAAPDQTQRFIYGETPPNEWWTLFQNDELNRLMQQAKENNFTLAAARASLAQAEELLAARSGTRLPKVDLTGGAGRQQLGAQSLGNFHLPTFTYYAIGADVRYTLDYTGGIARSIEQQRALTEYYQHELDAAWLSLTGNVAVQYFTIVFTQAQIQALEDLLAEDRTNVDLVSRAQQAGMVTKVDELSARAQLAQDATLLPPLRQQLDTARHALAVLLGKAPGEWADAKTQFASASDLRLPEQLPVSLPSELVRHRPDILSAESQLHAATAAVGVATANLYPQITLSGNVGQQATTTGHLFDASSLAWGIISGITAPLFDGGTLRAERRAALQAVQVSAANYQQTVLQSFGQVANLLQAARHDEELLLSQTEAMETARSSVDLARRSYSAGNTGVLTVLVAERQSLQARLGLLDAQSKRFVNTAQLLLAVGGSSLSGG